MKKNILFKLPPENSDELFFKILSQEYNIDINILNVLYKYFGEDIYFILNILAGNTISIPSTENINLISLYILIYNEIKRMKDLNIAFDESIIKLSEKLNITTNKVFIYYNQAKSILEV